MRFADHERRILNIEVDTRVLQWVHSRYDKIESARYDEMPVAKRVLLMTDRFMDLTAFRWDEQAVHALLNAMETASVHLDEKWALRRFGTRLYEEWLVFLDPSQSPGLLTLAIPDGGMVDLAPVHAVVSEALRFRSTGYGSEHLDAAFERLLSIGIELDEEVSVGDLARTLLEEGRLAAMARAGGAPRHQGGRVALPSPRSKGPRKEYWHQRTEPNDIQEATHHRAQELLAKKDDDLPYLLSLLDLYAAAGEEIEGRKLDLTLLVRMVKVSLTLSSASIPGDQFVEHAKRLFQYGRTQMAYEWHAQLVEAAPDHAELRNNLGFLLLYRGNVLDAQRELERATALGFDGGVHWINKGVVSVLLEKLEDAEQHLRKAAKQSSESVAAELVLLCGGATESDATASRVVLTAGSMKAIALCNLGLVLHRRKTDGAGKCFDDAVREEKKLSFALRAAGWFFHSVEQHRRAADHFRRARKLEPRHPMNDWENEQLPCYYFFKGGRNETCCCGSGKKFKHCCEAMMA
jgi:tetratricopeptide (TPR) repeat protein